ncbi:hypothetical protein HID58_046312 [Brassica napus]|uniref:KIB1-4 beta-propeller domain-containing protein n=1 Tax=Brassica napus TaxID=3708 RepID=A0ABQ8AW68_BRANA|nr:hypothetical protein HID58_046312 [Brassica napus]
MVTIGASHGWVASLKDEGILRLHDDLNPYALYKDPICIPLPPLVTLPHCQTKIIPNVSMSSSSPEDDEDCVVAVKFLGPQLSFCKPAGKSKLEWTNIKIENPCFYSSRVMFSKKYNLFLIPGSGGHLMGAWDPCNPSDRLMFESLRFENPPKLPTPVHELMDSCCMSQHLVESTSTGETFLVKQYRKTEYLMVYNLDDEGNAVYTQDMGDLTMFLSRSEPFCVDVADIPFSIASIASAPRWGEKILLCFSSYLQTSSLRQTSPCFVIGARPCLPLESFYHNRLGTLSIGIVNPEKGCVIRLPKKVSVDLVHNDLNDTMVTIGASHGWVASLKNDGILLLHDDLNPYALYEDPICLPLPPLVTLPHCQTKIITNVSMSSSSPENNEDCVVAVKFLGPQFSFCKPAGKSSTPEWTNIKIENPCFYSSRVMFSKKDNMFRIPGSGGHLIGSLDLCEPNDKLKLQCVGFENLPPKLPTPLMDSCCMSQHLVESTSTGETFLVKQYRKTAEGVARMKTEYLMVFKLDDEGNALYTEDMGDLTMFLSKSEPFCISSTSFPGFKPNRVHILDFEETACVVWWMVSPSLLQLIKTRDGNS